MIPAISFQVRPPVACGCWKSQRSKHLLIGNHSRWHYWIADFRSAFSA